MKKSFCAFLCVLVLLCSVAVVGFAEETETNLSYVEPSADTTLETKSPIENAISEVIGDELVDIGEEHDIDKKMSFLEKITKTIRDLFGKLADFANEISAKFRTLLEENNLLKLK